MGKNMGKPSGKDAESKKDVGRKANYKRWGWPEDLPTQRTGSARGQQQGNPARKPSRNLDLDEEGRDRKAGGGR